MKLIFKLYKQSVYIDNDVDFMMTVMVLLDVVVEMGEQWILRGRVRKM